MLLRSGVMYSSNTVEFRFLLIHKLHEETFRYYKHHWLFDRILDLIHVTGIATVDKNSASQYQKSVAPTATAIADLVNPFKKYEEERELKNKRDDLKKREFLDMLSEENPDGFSSLSDIHASLNKIKQAMATEE